MQLALIPLTESYDIGGSAIWRQAPMDVRDQPFIGRFPDIVIGWRCLLGISKARSIHFRSWTHSGSYSVSKTSTARGAAAGTDVGWTVSNRSGRSESYIYAASRCGVGDTMTASIRRCGTAECAAFNCREWTRYTSQRARVPATDSAPVGILMRGDLRRCHWSPEQGRRHSVLLASDRTSTAIPDTSSYLHAFDGERQRGRYRGLRSDNCGDDRLSVDYRLSVDRLRRVNWEISGDVKALLYKNRSRRSLSVRAAKSPHTTF